MYFFFLFIWNGDKCHILIKLLIILTCLYGSGSFELRGGCRNTTLRTRGVRAHGSLDAPQWHKMELPHDYWCQKINFYFLIKLLINTSHLTPFYSHHSFFLYILYNFKTYLIKKWSKSQTPLDKTQTHTHTHTRSLPLLWDSPDT